MKHLFTTVATIDNATQPVRVDCGFDRMLQHIYLTVFSAAESNPCAGVLYTSLMEQNGGFAEVDPMMDKLEEFGITAPEGLAERLWLDQAFNEGNGVKVWEV